MISANFATYKTLRSITLTDHLLTEFAHRKLGSLVATLPFLIELRLSRNMISSLASLNRKKAEGDEVEYWPRLQHCYLNSNKITSFTAVTAPKLLLLDLSHNEISAVPESDEGFKGHELLEFLDLSRNKLTNLSVLRGMPNLKQFYVGSNVNIRRLNGLDECRSLEVLHLRGCAVTLPK